MLSVLRKVALKQAVAGSLAALLIMLVAACDPASGPGASSGGVWQTDFFDDFNEFNPNNWQDQILWVNGEDQCYLRDGARRTREVSNGTLKLRVVDLGQPIACGNMDKFGKQHPPTRYVAGRLASKNRKEFIKGRWSARLRLHGNGEDGMFPAWWLLGARNNEPPIEEADENVCWPATGSGEIDIFEHFGSGGADHFASRVIVDTGNCNGDWQTHQNVTSASLNEYHIYSVEWLGGDLVYRIDGREFARTRNYGDKYPEPLFAILNYAKMPGSVMAGDWVMEVDWVRHELRVR